MAAELKLGSAPANLERGWREVLVAFASGIAMRMRTNHRTQALALLFRCGRIRK